MIARLPIIRHLRVRPRLTFSVIAGCGLYWALPGYWRQTTRLLTAWDCATAMYLLLAALMMANSKVEKIRKRAAQQDEGRIATLLFTVTAAIASLAAIIAELATAKAAAGHAELQHIALAGVTVFLSWSFMQTMFALHYAHEYYMEENGKCVQGLDFPGGNAPDYWDFSYFSFVIGTAAATADVNVTSRMIRRTVTLHCIVAFFFNTTILALTVNIAAGLF